MNSRTFLLPILFLALSLSFVYATDSEVAIVDGTAVSAVAVADVQKQEPIEDMLVSLISPANEKVFELGSDGESIDIAFEFTVEPMHPEASCVLNVWGTNDYALKTEITDSGKGVAVSEFKEGEYKWNVECMKQGVLFPSDQVFYFKVDVVEVPNNTNTNTNTGNGGGSSNNDDESNGRRLQPISLPLQELSTENEGSEDSDSSPGITGAVIGALGNKGALGIIVLVVVLGVAGLVIYNRRKLGVVKASK